MHLPNPMKQNVERLQKTAKHNVFINTIVKNLVASHHSTTAHHPWTAFSHHALHSHIPIHHYTNHTAVTIHSSTLIVLPHLHLIHSPTYKQHTSLHTLRSLVLPWLTFPSVFPSVSICVLPGLLTLSLLIVCCLPH